MGIDLERAGRRARAAQDYMARVREAKVILLQDQTGHDRYTVEQALHFEDYDVDRARDELDAAPSPEQLRLDEEAEARAERAMEDYDQMEMEEAALAAAGLI